MSTNETPPPPSAAHSTCSAPPSSPKERPASRRARRAAARDRPSSSSTTTRCARRCATTLAAARSPLDDERRTRPAGRAGRRRATICTSGGESAAPAWQPFDQFGATAWVKFQPAGVVGNHRHLERAAVHAAGAVGQRLRPATAPCSSPAKWHRTAEFRWRGWSRGLRPCRVGGGHWRPRDATAFTAQPWDHLVFTGSIEVGKRVMKAAAENLVPVTLELAARARC